MGFNEQFLPYPNDYFEVMTIDGKPFETTRIALNGNGEFRVIINYENVLRDFGPHSYIRFAGLTRVAHYEYSVTAMNGKYEEYTSIGANFYDIQLDLLYDCAGSANFIFGARWSGLENISFNKVIIYSGQMECVKGISVTGKNIYNEGDYFNKNDVTVTGDFGFGIIRELNDYTFYPTRALNVSDKSITVSCNGQNFDFPITVNARPVLKLAVKTLPTKLRYLSGETFDPTGMVVAAEYYDGTEKIISDYTLSGVKLSFTNNTVSINYRTSSITLKVDVYGQTLVCSAELQEKIDGQSDWTTQIFSGIYFNRINRKETRTVLYIPKKNIDFGNNESVRLKLLLTATSAYTKAVDFYVNGKLHHKLAAFKTVLVDAGIVNKKDEIIEENDTEEDNPVENVHKNEVKIVFSYFGGPYSFDLSGLNAPIMFISRVNDVGEQSTVKDFPLVDGVNIGVDLFDGKAGFVINDIAPDKSLLGFGVYHIYDVNSEYEYYGKKYRLNLHETLRCIDGSNRFFKQYSYTDAKGNNYGFNTILYYLVGNNKYYIKGDALNGLQADSENNLTYNGNKVYTELQTVGNQFLLIEPTDAVKNSAFYKNTHLPVLWLKGNAVTKGFDANGRLVMVNDDFGNYFTINYNYRGAVNSVTDCNGDTITFNYDANDYLSYIKDARGRNISYSYTTKSDFIDSPLNMLGYLIKITYASGYNLTLSYNLYLNDKIKSVSNSDGYRSEIEYNSKFNYGGVSSVITYSTVDKVPAGENLKTEISRLDFDYSAKNRTVITDINDNKFVYDFNDNGENTAYYEVTADVVTAAEKYEYNSFSSFKKIKADASTLNKTPLDYFSFKNGETTKSVLDENYNFVSSVEVTNIKLTNVATKTVKTNYSYNGDHKISQESVIETFSDYAYNTFINYTYNDKGALAKKSTLRLYTKSGLTVTSVLGTSVEEYEYDSKGCITKSKRYVLPAGVSNITSDKADDCFTKWCIYNDRRNVLYEKDQTSLFTTTYQYNADNVLIDKITMPGGGVFSYTYDGRDRVTKVSCTANNVENYNSTVYALSDVTDVSHSGQRPISYEYDEKRRLSKIYLNGAQYESLDYENNVLENGVKVDKLTRTNANGETFKAVVNKLGTSAKIYCGEDLTSDYSYSVSTNTAIKNDYLSGGVTTVIYDSYGNILQSKEEIAGEEITDSYEYNSRGQLVKVRKSYVVQDDTFTYDDWLTDCVSEMTTGGFSIQLNHDMSGRYTGKTVYSGEYKAYEESIEYVKNSSEYSTTLPSKWKSGGKEYQYGYDGQGNIAYVNEGSNVREKYYYDELNRLVREDNLDLNKTKLYSYDNNGNITKREELAYTVSEYLIGARTTKNYTYSGDKLISYNGESFVYDSVGNPTTYRGKAATWTMGRRLASYNGNTFKYNADGKRIEKNGIKYYYDSQGRLVEQSNNIVFLYDTTGLLGFKYYRAYYIYKKDIQGNIVGILNDFGREVVTYSYDAWGNFIIGGNPEYADIAELNPFRYRGYYYDVETGLYYLQSRYYDPEIGRFMTIDSINYADSETINGLNLYAYCGNNPVNNIDPEGHLFLSLLLVGAAILLFTPVGGAVVQTVVTAASYAGAAVASIWDEDIRNDMNAIHWNPFNTDESATLNSSKVSFYKGAPVFRTDGSRSGSFGAIFLQKGSSVDTLHHERGHNSQLMTMGIFNYGLMIGLPSLLEWSNRPYYDRPWEITADIFGGVTGRSHSQADINRGYGYLAVSSLFGPLGYIFLLGEF